MPIASPRLDRSTPPIAAEPPNFRFPEFTHTKLDNGLEIYAARRPRLPLLSLEIMFPAGSQYDTVGRPGVASLHGDLLDEGTKESSALEIANRVEALGGSLVTSAGWNLAYAEIELLAQDLAAGVDLLAEITRTPRFPPEEIERQCQQRMAEILRRQDQPAYLAEQRFSEVVYGDTVYGQPTIGTVESLNRLSRRDFREFYRHHVVPNGAALIAVGDLDPDRLVATIDRAFGDWQPGHLPAQPRIEPRPLNQTEIHIVDRSGAPQTQLYMGHCGVPRSHPDFPKLLILNSAFGGKFTSRINLNLREKHGYTYGANSIFTRRQGPGPFYIRTAVSSDVASLAIRELISEMRQVCTAPLAAEELKETQDYLVGVFPYTLQTNADLMKRFEALAAFDLPDDFYESYPAELTHYTQEEILEVAQRHLHPDNLAIVAVGPAEILSDALQDLGPVTVTHPNTVLAPETPTDKD